MAVCAVYAMPSAGAARAWRFINGRSGTPMCELGWTSVGALELTALPSLGEELSVPTVREADVLLVDGGDALYLSYWMQQSGLADLLPSLGDTVWVGQSSPRALETGLVVTVAISAGAQRCGVNGPAPEAHPHGTRRAAGRPVPRRRRRAVPALAA